MIKIIGIKIYNKIINKKAFTLIELLVVVAIIAILSAVVLVALNASKDRARTAAAKTTANNIAKQLEISLTDGHANLLAPINSSTGGGPICDTNCTNTATWPSLVKSGYVYSVIPQSDISTGSFSVRLIRPNDPNATIDPAVINDPNITSSQLGNITAYPVISLDLTDGNIQIQEIKPSSAPAFRTPPCGNYGDVNNDGYVKTDDADLVQSYAVGLTTFTPDQKTRGDVNGSGSVNATDGLLIKLYVQNTITTFTVCPQ